MREKKSYKNLIFCLYFVFVINLIFAGGENIENTVNYKLNKFEEKIIALGLNVPITASWQLIITLLSREDCRVCITNPPKELIESKESTLIKLSRPWLFFIHPVKSITSEILTTPRSEFLDYIYSYIEIDRCMMKNGQKDVNSIIFTKRNILGCNFMLRRMLKAGFVQMNLVNESAELQTEETSEFGTIAQGIYGQHIMNKYQCKDQNKHVIETQEIHKLCGSFLLKLSGMLNIISTMTSVEFRKKVRVYAKICRLLETT
ncbi:hypothetical protein RS030_192989 [Cryptosporidium xiaoi]|uniref:Uncharacterized protein n=1 Tax=Cryptosporidium xiaoi TaxID=659607 RepID=A0AAV9XZF9_9CRYT